MIPIARNLDDLEILGEMSRKSGNAGLKSPAC